jgi:hypothetical protein
LDEVASEELGENDGGRCAPLTAIQVSRMPAEGLFPIPGRNDEFSLPRALREGEGDEDDDEVTLPPVAGKITAARRSCCTHLAHLTLSKSATHPFVLFAIGKAQELIALFHQSGAVQRKFEEGCKAAKLRHETLLAPGGTRTWRGFQRMAERICLSKGVLSGMNGDGSFMGTAWGNKFPDGFFAHDYAVLQVRK